MKHKLFTRNFLLLLLGQASSLFGNFILKLALSMYVLETTGSASVFAAILSLALIPTILLSPFGGILADRVSRKKIMVALDALTGMSVFTAAFLLTKETALTGIGILLVILSVLGAFETPTVQACIPSMLSGDNITRGNAVVNQIASLSYLIAPMLGGILYSAFGLKPVMYACTVCFFATALSECFLKIEDPVSGHGGNLITIVREDFSASMRFILHEQRSILKMLLLTALSRFFVMGTVVVGLPFLVRTVLGMSASHYGLAESMMAVATILGSIAAGILTGKWKMRRLSGLLASLGFFIVLPGAAFLFPLHASARYGILTGSVCGMQIAVSMFSIFAVSFIQQKTPNHLAGKVMAYTSAITLCAQPVGQMVYGALFDWGSSAVYLVLIPTGLIAGVIGLLSSGSFERMEKEIN